MTTIDIQGEQFTLYTTWDNVTLERFQRLCALKIPEKYEEFVKACFSDKEEDYEKITTEITMQEWLQTFPAYFGEVIAVLSDIPYPVINRMHRAIREQLYENYFYPFTMSVIAGDPYCFKDGKIVKIPRFGTKSFDFEGEIFFFPKSLFFNEYEIPLYKESILTFSEASDIEIAITEWGEKGIEAVAQMMAIYCRKEGEQYNQENILERIPKFRRLPMPIVWEVFFCISELGVKSVAAMLLYSLQLVRQIHEGQLMKAG